MVKYSEKSLDGVFSALADPTRRGVVKLLSDGSRPVSELSRQFPMSLPGFMKHLGILENAGLIRREKEGRVVSCTLAAAPMKEASEWLTDTREFWEQRLDSLARFLYHQEETQAWQPAKPKRGPRSPSPVSSTRRPPRSGAQSRSRKA
ncbi:MAG: transcriptional regulator [Betaproteobacteria bacterium]|nr:transcriptional regulator [Betaproteobacteria bacterium]